MNGNPMRDTLPPSKEHSARKSGQRGEPNPSEAEGTHVWVRSEEGLR